MSVIRKVWHSEPAVVLGVIATLISCFVGDLSLTDAVPLIVGIVTRSQVSPVKVRK